MFLAGVEVPGELVEWLQWMVGGRTADVLSEALYIHSPLVLLSARDDCSVRMVGCDPHNAQAGSRLTRTVRKRVESAS